MPSQKVGTPSASALQPLRTRSSHEPGDSALTMATGTPSSSATMRRGDGELQRRRQSLRDQVQDRLAAVDREAEIAPERVLQPRGVLDQHRPIEPELLGRGLDLLLAWRSRRR